VSGVSIVSLLVSPNCFCAFPGAPDLPQTAQKTGPPSR